MTNGEIVKTYSFDSANKMSKAVIRRDGKTVTAKYIYDGDGNRIYAKTDTNGVITGNISYVTDPESPYHNIIQTKDSISGKTSVITHAKDETISIETSGTISYYKTDENHSITEIQTKAGKKKVSITYDEYGNPENPEAVSNSGNIFAYTGHVYEESTGLYYAKARYYDSETGRFLSRDSYQGNLQEPVTLNPYIYAGHNPFKYIDPSGHIAVATIAKMGTGALFDMGMQLAANYFFNSKTAGNFKKSFNKVNWWQVTRSGVESLFHFKSKTLTAAITGLGDVIVNWMKQGKKYSCTKALKDFAFGFLSDLATRYICKFGKKAVAKGMEKMGVSHVKIKKLTGDAIRYEKAFPDPRGSKATAYYTIIYINGLLGGDYKIETFCSEFSRIHDLEVDYNELTEEENIEFGDLCEMAGRFSNNIDELKIANMYFSEKDIINKARDVKKILKEY